MKLVNLIPVQIINKMEQGGNNGGQPVIHFADVQPQLLPAGADAEGDEEIVAENMGRYLQLTGPAMNETVSSRQYSETEAPAFTVGIRGGPADPSKMRGRRGTEFKVEDMVAPADQALLEWKNIEFFVPVKKPPR